MKSFLLFLSLFLSASNFVTKTHGFFNENQGENPFSIKKKLIIFGMENREYPTTQSKENES